MTNVPRIFEIDDNKANHHNGNNEESLKITYKVPSAEIHRNLEEETSNKESKLDMNET